MGSIQEFFSTPIVSQITVGIVISVIGGIALLIVISILKIPKRVFHRIKYRQKPVILIPLDKNRHFVKRQVTPSNILKNLKANDGKTTLHGNGGFGKTQIAINYATKYQRRYKYRHILYIDAAGLPQLENSYREIAIRTGMPTAHNESFAKKVRPHVVSWLEANKNSLLIYDNAEGLNKNLSKYLPQNFKGHMLFCTRVEHNLFINHKYIKIDTFTPNEALRFLQKAVKSIDNIDNAKQLAKALSYVPLALAIAAAYINEVDGMTCSGYLNLLEKEGKLPHLSKILGDYGKAIAETWGLSLKMLSKETQELFGLSAYCAPANIPLSMFIDGHQHLPKALSDKLAPNETNINIDILKELQRYALLAFRYDVNSNTLTFSIHGLVQETLRYNHKKAEDKTYIISCLAVAHSVFWFEYGDTNFEERLPHVMEIAGLADKALNGDERAQEMVAKLYNRAGMGLLYKADYNEALEVYHKALDIAKKVHGLEHPNTAITYNNIATVYYNQGKYENALELYQKTLEIKERVVGMEHPSTAITYNNMAVVYHNQGKYEKALELYQMALKIKEKVLGMEHPDTALTYGNIAMVYCDQGKYEKALELCQKASDIKEKVLGMEHPDTAGTYNNMAIVYDAQGNYEKALELHQRALKIREKVLGVEHPDTADTYNNMAIVYVAQGEHKKALEWYLKCYIIRIKKLGHSHPHTLDIIHNMKLDHTKAAIRQPFDKWLSKNTRRK